MRGTVVEIRLLGGFGVSIDGVDAPERAWRLRKAKTLVKVLVLQPGRRLHREQALDLLWPELDPAAAHNNLHGVIHAARRVLGAERVLLRDGMVALDGDLAFDVDAFGEAAARARELDTIEAHEAALRAYGGELLPEDRYAPWADEPRAALREVHTTLALRLADLLAERGRDADAVRALQAAIAADGLNESAHRALMRLYERAGRRQEALAQYGRLRDALRTSLGADPDPETRRVLRELLAARDVATRPEPAPAEPALPVQLTSFVGRKRELAEVGRLLARARLLTLTGPGGSGKTRLAIAAAERAAADHADGVYFVELGGIAEAALVAETAATAVGIRVPSRRAAAEALAEHLASRQALLVLDTCEHVVAACAALAETILRSCERVTVLATSREPLRCDGELTWRVPGLAVPDPGARSLPAFGATESVRLFAERAGAAAPGFALEPGNADAVAAICFRLDGMPLAIELAAARTSALAPAQIAARLEDSLELLAGGRRTGLTRQATLRATIGWSHDLLEDDERALFRRLSVFAGSFSLEAAEEVCAAAPLEGRRVAGILARLVDKSLVTVDDAASARYRLLDTIRQFAAERLDQASELRATERRHRTWAQALAEAHDPATSRGAASRSLRRLEQDHDNVRAALATGLRDDPAAALRLAATVWRFWLDRNSFTEGARDLAAALRAAPDDGDVRVRALLAAAALALRRGDTETLVGSARDAVAVARRVGEPLLLADALGAAALMFVPTPGPAASAAARDEALELLKGDDPRGRAVRASLLHVSALVPFYEGDAVEAGRRIEAAIAQLTQVPPDAEPFFEGMTLGFVVLPEGPGGALRPIFEETIMLFHRYAREPALAYALCNKAVAARALGQRDDARAALDEALERFRTLGDRAGEALALTGLGSWARTFGEPDLGVASLERAFELRRERGDRRAMAMTENDLALVLAAAGELARARDVFAAVLERFRAADDAPGVGGVLVNRGGAEERAGDLELAAQLLEQGADVWERHVYGHLPAWAWLAAADVRRRAGDGARAVAARDRAELLFSGIGDARGIALSTALLDSKRC